jgi:phospholipid transport system transporter-binding protein
MASDIQVNSVGQFLVVGELNFTTVPTLSTRGKQLISASPMPIFDLRLTSSSDNAGLALLVGWMRYAKKLNKSLRFVNLPTQLLEIAKISGLTLPIKNLSTKEKAKKEETLSE